MCNLIRVSLKEVDNVKSIQTIQTGWTNITMDVEGETQNYIFRFPRNLFFAKMMIKDCLFCQFLKNKVSIAVPDMQLKLNNNRPFSVHPKIKGVSLLSEMDKITTAEQADIVNDLSVFLSQLHTIPVEYRPDEIEETLGEFLDGLASVHNGDYEFAYHDALREMEKNPLNLRIVHGDFHPGNVLINEGRVNGVIDFAFASVSDNHADLGRFLGRSNPLLAGALIEAYQYQTKTICDLRKIHEVAEVFKYVEYKYVQYMQSYHPEINIPASVLQMAQQGEERYAQKASS
ncbi:MAG: aminoglycoside phosphotransferase family protein [Alphaproteobacteria bacterium]|nr:aminoglycoside phosphotransferase family protein [Alphaproteobacteria bacterium]